MIAMSCLSSCADPEGAMEVCGTGGEEQACRVRLVQFPFEFGVSMATTRVVDDTIALTLISTSLTSPRRPSHELSVHQPRLMFSGSSNKKIDEVANLAMCDVLGPCHV